MSTTSSPWIRWPGYLAWGFLALIPLSVLTVRSGAWQQGLLLFTAACVLSLLLLLWFALQSFLPRFAEQRGNILRRALPAIPGTVVILLVLAGPRVPAIHDITTDTDDPPRFETVQDLRGANANSLEIDPEVIDLQRQGYADLDTIRSDRSYDDVYTAALNTAQDLGWSIVNDDINAGIIEAVERTAIMGFRDDIVIRIRTDGASTHVDLRSASRVGISDLGANAKRIRRFSEQFRATLGS